MKGAQQVRAIPKLCAAVRRIRTLYGDTQEEFGQRVCLAQMTVSRFERGATIPANPDTLDRLFRAAAALGLAEEAALLKAAAEARARRRRERFMQIAGRRADSGMLEILVRIRLLALEQIALVDAVERVANREEGAC